MSAQPAARRGTARRAPSAAQPYLAGNCAATRASPPRQRRGGKRRRARHSQAQQATARQTARQAPHASRAAAEARFPPPCQLRRRARRRPRRARIKAPLRTRATPAALRPAPLPAQLPPQPALVHHTGGFRASRTRGARDASRRATLVGTAPAEAESVRTRARAAARCAGIQPRDASAYSSATPEERDSRKGAATCRRIVVCLRRNWRVEGSTRLSASVRVRPRPAWVSRRARSPCAVRGSRRATVACGELKQ